MNCPTCGRPSKDHSDEQGLGCLAQMRERGLDRDEILAFALEQSGNYRAAKMVRDHNL